MSKRRRPVPTAFPLGRRIYSKGKYTPAPKYPGDSLDRDMRLISLKKLSEKCMDVYQAAWEAGEDFLDIAHYMVTALEDEIEEIHKELGTEDDR